MSFLAVTGLNIPEYYNGVKIHRVQKIMICVQSTSKLYDYKSDFVKLLKL